MRAVDRRIKGDKNIFAIELEIVKRDRYDWAKACLWIGGIQVGWYEDVNFLSIFKNGITGEKERFLHYKSLNLDKVEPESFFESLYAKDEELGPYLKEEFYGNLLTHSLGEAFDYFSIFLLRQDNDMHFFWTYRESSLFNIDHPKGVQHKVVDYQYFCDVVDAEELWKLDDLQ